MCDEIINAAESVSANVMSAVAIHFQNKKVRSKMDCYFLHTVLLLIILLFIIAIICYYYAKHRSKQKQFGVVTMKKWRTMNLEKLVLKIVRVIISMT